MLQGAWDSVKGFAAKVLPNLPAIAAAPSDPLVPSAAAPFILDGIPRHFVFSSSDVVVGDQIGQGSFGRVFRGTLRGMPVCIKVSRQCMMLCRYLQSEVFVLWARF